MTKRPRTKQTDNGITVIDGNNVDVSQTNEEDKSTDPDVSLRRTSSAARPSSIVVIYYIIPTFAVWLGSFITHRVPSTSSVPNISTSHS